MEKTLQLSKHFNNTMCMMMYHKIIMYVEQLAIGQTANYACV